MLRNVVAVQQRRARGQGAGGEVFGQLEAHRSVDDEPGGGDPLLDLASDVGCVPGRAFGTQPAQHHLDGSVTIQPTDTRRRERDASTRVAVAKLVEVLVPGCNHGRTVGRDHLVGSCLGPGPPVPGPPELRSGFLSGVRSPPRRLVGVDVASDLRRARTEPSREGGQFGDLAGGRVEGEPVRCECCPEPGIGDDRCVADPVDRLQRVPGTDRMDAAPRSVGEDAGIDLEVQVAVRVPGT